jgi:hypothetical protein
VLLLQVFNILYINKFCFKKESSADSPLENQQFNNNIVILLCREIIQRVTNDRQSLSHTFVILMYLFCALFVQKCSSHIFDQAKKFFF